MESYERLAEDGGGTLKADEVFNAVSTAAMNDKPEVVIGSKGTIATSPSLSQPNSLLKNPSLTCNFNLRELV